MRLRPDRLRCAALAARVIAACAVLNCARLCAPQDRLRRYLRASPPSWALSTPSLRAPHAHVQFVHVGRRGEKRMRDACAIGRPFRAALFLGACALVSRDCVRLCE